MSSCGSNASIEASAPLISAVVNNALFHSKFRINQILPQVIHIITPRTVGPGRTLAMRADRAYRQPTNMQPGTCYRRL